MANSALGTKRICTGCAAKFYDLGKNPIVCPACETVFVPVKSAPHRARSVFDPVNQPPLRGMGTLRERQPAEEAESKPAEKPGEDAGGVPMLEDVDEE